MVLRKSIVCEHADAGLMFRLLCSRLDQTGQSAEEQGEQDGDGDGDEDEDEDEESDDVRQTLAVLGGISGCAHSVGRYPLRRISKSSSTAKASLPPRREYPSNILRLVNGIPEANPN